MNRYEQLIVDFLNEYKEVSLEKIGIIKITNANSERNTTPVEFTFDKKAVTTPELIDYIAQKNSKSKMLIASDLESHFMQAREFINIGKTYEIINAGFIKKNNSGLYEFIPASQAVKAQKNFSKPVQQKKQRKKTASSAVQLFTLFIVLAILSGLGWEAYQFFVKPHVNNTETIEGATVDSTNNSVDSSNNNADTINGKDTTSVAAVKTIDTTKQADTSTYKDEVAVTVKYYFETTDLLLRAQTRTAKLISFGDNAGYDSAANGPGKLYSLYILKKTKIADTLRIKDSIAKFLQKPVEIKIVTEK